MLSKTIILMFIIISLSILLLSIKCHGSHSSYHHTIDDVTTANAMPSCDVSCPNLLSTTTVMMTTTDGKEVPIEDSKCCSTHVSSPYSAESSSSPSSLSSIPTAPSSCGTCQSSTCSGNGFKSCLDHHHPYSYPPVKMMTEQQCQAYQSSNCVVMLANPLCDPSSSICWGTISTNLAIYSGNYSSHLATANCRLVSTNFIIRTTK
jgi:hypothetical protein